MNHGTHCIAQTKEQNVPADRKLIKMIVGWKIKKSGTGKGKGKWLVPSKCAIKAHMRCFTS